MIKVLHFHITTSSIHYCHKAARLKNEERAGA
jgi:hypothetical protein